MFEVVPEPVKVFDAAKIARAADGFDNFLTRVGLNNNNALSAGFYTFDLMTRNRIQLEAAYRGSWIVGAIVDHPAQDMTRAGIDITSTLKPSEDPKKLRSTISRLKVAQSLCENLMWGSLYGGSLAIIQIEGQELAEPLRLETITKNQFQGLVVYDRWQLNPDLTEVIDSGPDMGLPKYYYIVNDPRSLTAAAPTDNGQYKVHYSRCIRSIGIKLPYWQAITEMMWGESKLERLWDRLISFDTATMSAANLIERANNRTIAIDGLREILAAGGEAQAGLEAMFERMRIMQSNEGMTLLDKNDEYKTDSYTFAGLDSLLLQFGQQLSGACGEPLMRLFGQAPAGLGDTGDSVLRSYYDNIKAQQESDLRNPWEIILKVLWRSCFGTDAPEDLEFEFVPLWQMSTTDKVNNAKTMTETVIGAVESGLISKSTGAQELKDNSADTGLFSSITDEDIAELKDIEDNPPELGELDPADPNAKPDEIKTPVPSLDSASLSTYEKIKAWLKK